MGIPNGALKSHPDVIDIRREELDQSLLKLTLKSLDPVDGASRTLPSLLLYDDVGLKHFEEITYLDEYYLTNAEIEALERHASKIAERLPEGARLVELGSGNLRKVDILLRAFEKAHKAVEYYALDLSLPELRRTLSALRPGTYDYVKSAGLHGTYDDGLAWLTRTKTAAVATCVLSMGSSIGNFSRDGAAEFLHQFSQILGPQDALLVGVDSCQDADRIRHAYDDSKGVTEKFYRNGLVHANLLLGYQGFNQDEWAIEGRYNKLLHRHEADYVALVGVEINGIRIPKGAKIRFELATKYSQSQMSDLWHAAGLVHQAAFDNLSGDYNVHLLTPASIAYPTKAEEYASHPVPSLGDWHELWAAWDNVTRGMTPEEELLSKPIKLRNDLIFYLGHIPVFCDIHMTKSTNGKHTEPEAYTTIFERGIDPDVENPELCHDHSDVPDVWPPLGDLIDYQNRVRRRVTSLVSSGEAESNRKLGRALWLAFEHEVMHLETYLYMLLQSSKVQCPPGTAKPDFQKLDAKAQSSAVPNHWFRIPSATVDIGLDDPENDLDSKGYFGWDSEKPRRRVQVDAFEAQARAISVGDYVNYLMDTGSPAIPASWIRDEPKFEGLNGCNGHAAANGFSDANQGYQPDWGHDLFSDVSVRTVYGPIPLKYARHWPVMASYDELAAYAKWANGDIPTLEQVRSLYVYAESPQEDVVQEVPSSLISAVNGHLSNDGVEETPPQSHSLNGFPEKSRKQDVNPRHVFIDLNDCNVGFGNWTPTAVTPKGNRLCGQSDFGGVWEWTSSVLEKWEGFEPQASYPGYTADFFDGKHNIVLGGSWATHPRVAGRKTFINWYQRSYPYTWAGARLVRHV